MGERTLHREGAAQAGVCRREGTQPFWGRQEAIVENPTLAWFWKVPSGVIATVASPRCSALTLCRSSDRALGWPGSVCGLRS